MLDDTKVQPFVLLAKGARGRALVDLITKATSEPGLFGFSELLAVPQIQEIANGEHVAHFHLLQLFAYGTWPDYIGAAAGSLPELSPAQVNKLKQLTVVSLALQQKVLSYASLQSALPIDSVRALEDYLITECFYADILKGKLDQKAGCVQVHDVVGRDVRPDQMPVLQQGFNTWMNAAESLLTSIEERIVEAGNAAQAGRRRKELAATAMEEAKKIVKSEMEMRSAEMMLDETNGLDFSMDDDRADSVGGPLLGGLGFAIRGDRQDRVERRAAGAARSGKKRIQR